MIVLASSSPRRRELVKLLGLPSRAIRIEVDESLVGTPFPSKAVCTLSLRKANHAFEKHGSHLQKQDVLISADTVVALGRKILNKPKSAKEGFLMLKELQGREHSVFTGVTLKNHVRTVTMYEKTNVLFAPMSDREIKRYLSVANPLDKAGSYGIQDDAIACFVSKIRGCYHNVVGFPLPKIYKILKESYEIVSH